MKLISFIYLLAILFCRCGLEPQAGGSTNTCNARITGSLFDKEGTAAQHTQVKCIRADYIPGVSNDTLVRFTYTDHSGNYTFEHVDSGTYVISAVDTLNLSRWCTYGVMVDSQKVDLPSAVLDAPGRIRIDITGSTLTTDGFFYIQGTTIRTSLAGNNSDGSITLDSIPYGVIPAIKYARTPGISQQIVRDSVAVKASETATIYNIDWRFTRILRLNTTASGAGITSNVTGFPVLLRFSAENFNFNEVVPDGSDLQFKRNDNRTLQHEIERWNLSSGRAEVWVTVDTIFGNDSLQSISMYWGNPKFSSVTKPKNAFDTLNGFQGVWHLNDVSGDSIQDASPNRFIGISPDTATPGVTDGIIGLCRSFDGVNDYITMPNTADSKLDFPEDGYFSISAWVYVDSFDNVYRTIMTKGYEQYFLQLSYFPGDKPLWQFSVFRKSDNWNMSHISAIKNQWVFLTGVRQGTAQFLYCNGELVAATSATYPQGVSRDTTNDFTIGRFLKEATFPEKFGFCFFKGKIDEVRISSMAYSSDWIRLCFMNQRSDDKLVSYK
ncbi:MAG: DUF2341 domain-containing protein [Fibrobacter sp.]|nr:DUF2341 domain-containing protein [Fibrobacter sp.]